MDGHSGERSAHASAEPCTAARHAPGLADARRPTPQTGASATSSQPRQGPACAVSERRSRAAMGVPDNFIAGSIVFLLAAALLSALSCVLRCTGRLTKMNET